MVKINKITIIKRPWKSYLVYYTKELSLKVFKCNEIKIWHKYILRRQKIFS